LDLGGFTFGFGLRWENAMTSVLGLPSRFGDAFQVDFAEASYGEVLNETYRGALIHYPISPEPFHLSDPREQRAWIQGEPHSVFLDWEKASDPDPFDEVKYFLMVDPSKPKIETAVRELEENSGSLREWTSAIGQELMFTTVVAEPEYTLSVEEGGFYYWAVAAFDLAGHVRIARKGDGKVGRFIVAVPDLMARNLEFLPLQAILPAPDQGELTFNIVNQGTAASGGFVVWVQTRLLPGRHAGTAFQTIRSMAVSDLAFGADTTVTIPWQAVRPGWYEIRVVVDPDSAVVEYREDNNSLSVFVATLPKGRVTVPDSVEVMVTGYDSQEVPIVPEVFFEAHSNNVDSAYFVPKGNLPALLTALAERLLEHPDIQVKLYGSIDLLSGENDPALADTRAQAVQSALVNLGILPDRLEVVQEHPQRILGRRTMPANPQDAEWIMQQDRLVSFSVPQKDEEILFQPFRFAVDTTMRDSVQFHVQFVSPAGVRRWDLESGSSILDIHKDGAAFSDSVSGLYSWRGTDQGKVVVARNRWVPYRLVLTDTLGRTFSTAVDSIFIQEKRTVRRQELFGAAKFAQVEPVYAFYWDRVMSVAEEMIKDRSLRLRFEGHACAIGPDYVNNKLSLERAQSFTKAFLDRVKSTYPLDYQDIANRTAQPIGFGEKEPLIVKIKGLGDVLLGDNRSPIGRYLNRRIAVLLYREY
ncbi:MAG TPA: CARDB domain-containing protein, partial [bacterium]